MDEGQHRHIGQRHQHLVPFDGAHREGRADPGVAHGIVQHDEQRDGQPQREGEAGPDHVVLARRFSSARQAARSAEKSPSIHQRSTASSSAPTCGPGFRPSASASAPLTGNAGGVQRRASASAARQSAGASSREAVDEQAGAEPIDGGAQAFGRRRRRTVGLQHQLQAQRFLGREFQPLGDRRRAAATAIAARRRSGSATSSRSTRPRRRAVPAYSGSQ